MGLITQEQMVKLLGRSLSTTEVANFDLYLKIAVQRLEELLCASICKESGERTYGTRSGYRTVYIDIFQNINTVTIDGEEVSEDDYTIMQNARHDGSWYNIIQFDRKRGGEDIAVDAEWGFKTLPADLQLFLAKLFAQGTLEQTSDNQVKSKKIEDFTVTYKDGATFDEFVLANAATLNKYSQCNAGAIRHGSVRRGYDLRSIR